MRLEATVPDTEELRWWLRGFGDAVEVLAPKKLRDEFVSIVKRSGQVYQRNRC